MSFSNFSSASETSFNENSNAESDVFTISKFFIIKKTDKSSINFFNYLIISMCYIH